MEQGCRRAKPNCVNQNQSKCLECAKGFKLAGDECLSLTQPPVLPAHCISLNSSRGCSACEQGIPPNNSGYNLKNSQCVLTTLVCNLTEIFKGCLFTENGQCVTCKPNFMLTSGRCKEIVIPYCLTVNNSVCAQCDLCNPVPIQIIVS